MKADGAGRPDLGEVREYHVRRLNHALRRPGMYGGEITLRLTMDAVAYIDGLDEVWQAEYGQLGKREAFTSLGVHGAFAQILPGYRDDGAVASVYADIAWRHGWLTVDRTLPEDDLRPLRDEATRWCAQDRSLDEVLAELGSPSVSFGSSNPRYPKTLAYATDRASGLVCLHFASTYDWTATEPQSESPPVLLAVRHGDGPFAETFVFTPTGTTYR
ncbi:hypothetical protein [Micromonospora avicenniae]|uniref:Uncharacterized protein n=1 Tax=Micromonospora avicenniae TaxID=1198245 RepID=A0A1N7EFZ6_9ACTN|nr:hypothetical protein [Micromonospora avicenniae]SIR86990.1 hypothetical protein SAMN05444858_12338 [Micromonospora avicenniae]